MRGERANVQFNLKELAEKQVQRKLDMRALRVEEQLEQYRESYVRSMVEWNVQVRCHTDVPPRAHTSIHPSFTCVATVARPRGSE